MNWLRSILDDKLICILLFLFALAIFWFSPVRQVSDSRYSMLLSESLIKHRSFALDHYKFPPLPPTQREEYVMYGDLYQIEIVRGHLYYFFPPGSSLLSIPYVAIANAVGVTAANPDGSYNHQAETLIESGLAAILMAALTVVFFLTARLLLPLGWSLVIAVGGALGTQIWSTASRGMWSHTWGVLLLGMAIYLLMGQETGKLHPRPILLATLLSWLYFVRPTNSIFIAGITVYLFIRHRRVLRAYLVTGSVWLVVFVLYSWHNFGQLLPNYYRASRLHFEIFGTALTGNSISPSRGIFVYVPVLLFVIFLLVHYWRQRTLSGLVWLAIVLSVANLIVISGFSHWWGGAGYGARLSTDGVPWLVLLGIFGVNAMLRWRKEHRDQKHSWTLALQLTIGALLLAVSIFINGRGATALETWRWNQQPQEVSLMILKLWDWRQPQFLAGLIRPPVDREYPIIDGKTLIDFRSPDADKFVWYGWSGPEPEFRWTEAREAALVFGLQRMDTVTLKIRLKPFVSPGLRDQQRLAVELNDVNIGAVSFDQPQTYEVSFVLPRQTLKPQNVLTFKLPDAESPQVLKLSVEERLLGIAVEWMEFQPS